MSSNWREFCGFIDIFVESVTKVLKSHAGVERNLMYLLREKRKSFEFELFITLFLRMRALYQITLDQSRSLSGHIQLAFILVS